MKILLVTYEYPPDSGGVSAYLGGLFGTLPETNVLHLNLPKRKFGWLWQLPRIWLAARKADVVVVSHVLPLGTAAMLVGKPYVVIVHGLDLRSVAARPAKRMIAKRVLKSAKLVVANSRATSSELVHFGIDPAQTLVLTPCPSQLMLSSEVKTHEAARDGIRSKLGFEGKKVLLSVGRFVSRKGFDRLIQLLPRLRESCGDVVLVIAGKGSEEKRLRQQAANLGMAEYVRFVIAPDTDVLAALYRSADVFSLAVRASESDVEGFGIVFLEAGLFGLPAVSTRVGGIPEAVVDGVTGVLVDPDSDEALLVGLRGLLENPETAKSLGKSGRERVLSDFLWKTRSQEIMKRLV